MSITAKDIAENLGISTSSVSLAMNGRPGISSETRKRVLAEADRLGYSVDRPSMDNGSIKSVRYVIFIDAGDTVKETSFYSIILKSIELIAKRYGYNVIVSYFYSNGNWAEQIASVCKGVEGLVILATEMTDRHIEKAYSHGLEKQSIPIILVDNATSLVEVDCVVNDGLRGAYNAVNYLLDRGHPDVGYLRSSSRIDNFDERQAGVMKAREERGISAPLNIVDVGISTQAAYDGMYNWLEEGGKPISAYFADNDTIAAACIRAMKAKGWLVPEEISVVSFDDMPICTMVDPNLSTVKVMIEGMGMAAMELLHQRISGGKALLDAGRDGVYRTAISTKLVERESAADYSPKPSINRPQGA